MKNLIEKISKGLNRALFGAGVENDSDLNILFTRLFFAYLINCLCIFIAISAIFYVCGIVHAPLTHEKLLISIGTSNLITFLVMLVASVTWRLHPKPLGRLLTYDGSRLFIALLVLTVLIFALLIMPLVFIVPRWGVFLMSVAANAFAIQSLMLMRLQKSATEESNEP